MMRKLAMIMGLIGACNLYAATITVSAPVGVYTQVAGSGGSNQWITAGRDGAYCFSATQPASSAICHHSNASEYIPVSSMGAGIYLWFKPDTQATTVAVTQASDAVLLGVPAAALPAGASTSANQSTEITALNTINTTLGSPLQTGGSVVVTSAPTTAVTGTFFQATQPVSASSLPLPTGAATAANQTSGSQKTQIVDNTNTNFGTSSNPFSVNVLTGGAPSDIVATGTLSALNATVTTGALNGASTLSIEYNGVTGSAVGGVEIDVSNDGTVWREVGILQGVDGVMPFSAGVGDFTAAQRLHLLTSVTGAKYARALMYAYTSGSATVTLRASTGTSPFEFGKMTFLGKISSSLTNIESNTNTPLSQLATNSLQTTANTKLDTINTTLGTPLQAGGNVVVTSAPTTAVTGTFWQATQPVSVSSLPLPSGAATAGNQSTEITSLGTIATNTTGVATASNQATANSSLSAIATNTGNIPAQGLAATSASLPVSQSKDVETDCSGTITTGGVSQTLRSSNASDKSIEIQNLSNDPLYFKYGTTAAINTSGNYRIASSGGYYSNTISNQRVDIIGATTGDAFTCTIRQ